MESFDIIMLIGLVIFSGISIPFFVISFIFLLWDSGRKKNLNKEDWKAGFHE